MAPKELTYKMVKITVPSSTMNFPNGKSINKFYENLKGVFNLKAKEMNYEKTISYSDIFKKILECEEENKTEIIISEKDYKKIFELVKSTPGWGDFSGQIELYEAFENVEQIGTNTNLKA